MTKFVKIAAIAAAALAAVPAVAAPVGVTGAPPSASARIIKPLTLTATGALDFGTIVMNGVTATRTVTLNADTTISCATELVCAANGTVPTYNVTGTQGQLINIIKNTSVLNGSNGGTLTLTPVGHARQFGRAGRRFRHRRLDRHRPDHGRRRLHRHRRRPGRLQLSQTEPGRSRPASARGPPERSGGPFCCAPRDGALPEGLWLAQNKPFPVNVPSETDTSELPVMTLATAPRVSGGSAKTCK